MSKNQNLPHRISLNTELEWYFRRKIKEKKKIDNQEEKEQMALVEWLLYKKIPHFAVPNGGSRNKIVAVKLQKMGVSAGVPDLMIPLPNKYHHGLFLEMKRREGGVLSNAQQEWIDYLIDNGYCAVVCNGWSEAVMTIERYLRERLTGTRK